MHTRPDRSSVLRERLFASPATAMKPREAFCSHNADVSAIRNSCCYSKLLLNCVLSLSRLVCFMLIHTRHHLPFRQSLVHHQVRFLDNLILDGVPKIEHQPRTTDQACPRWDPPFTELCVQDRRHPQFPTSASLQWPEPKIDSDVTSRYDTLDHVHRQETDEIADVAYSLISIAKALCTIEDMHKTRNLISLAGRGTRSGDVDLFALAFGRMFSFVDSSDFRDIGMPTDDLRRSQRRHGASRHRRAHQDPAVARDSGH